LVSIQFAHTEAPVESRQPRGAARDDEFDRSMRATTPSEVRRARGRRFIASRRRVTVRRARSRDARARIVRATSRGAAALATRARATSHDDASERRARERAETNEWKRTWARPALTANVPRSVSVDIAFVDVHLWRFSRSTSRAGAEGAMVVRELWLNAVFGFVYASHVWFLHLYPRGASYFTSWMPMTSPFT